MTFRSVPEIENLLEECVNDLVKNVKLSELDEEEREHADQIEVNATAGQQVMHDLFTHQGGLHSLDGVEDFLEKKSLLPESGITASMSALEDLYTEVRERAASEGIDFNNHDVFITADNVSELQAKLALYSDRGGFAPLVLMIKTQFNSPLLEQGIEIVDLPGTNDTNLHTAKTSEKFLESCSRAILVANMDRVTTKPELDAAIRRVLDQKGAENVCLVLRGREV